jgi:hypothetical protein
MEQIQNIPPGAATDEPAFPSLAPAAADRPAARVSNRLAESLVEPALDCGRDVRADRATRGDGWTPERIRSFLNALAECGVVEDAARAAGISKQSAYNLRNRTAGRAFHVAWTAAEHLARRRLSEVVMSRALNGCVEVIMRDGKVWGERHRFDNRLTMAVLTRLDQKVVARDEENKVARLVSEEWDQYLDVVCAGGEGAADFIADRVAADGWTPSPEARTLERCENYTNFGVGLPEEFDKLERKRRRKKRKAPKTETLADVPDEPAATAGTTAEAGPEAVGAPGVGAAFAEEEPDAAELEGEGEGEIGGDDGDRGDEDQHGDEVDDDDGNEGGDDDDENDPFAAAAAEAIRQAAAALASGDAQASGNPATPAADPAADPAPDRYPGWVAPD